MKVLMVGLLLWFVIVCLHAGLAWPDPVVVFSAPNTQCTGTIVKSLGDDAVVVWLQRVNNMGLYQIRMQIVLADGSLRFDSEGVLISSSCISNNDPLCPPCVVVTPEAEIFISWFDSVEGSYRAQLFSADAQPLWGVEPISLSGIDNHASVIYAEGAFITVYSKQESGTIRIWGQKIVDGVQVWPNGGKQLVAPHPQYSSGTQSYSVVGSYIAWNLPSLGQLFALKINAEGDPAPGFDAWGKQISQRSYPYHLGSYTFMLQDENLYCRWHECYEVHPSFEYWSLYHIQQLVSPTGELLIPEPGVVDLDEGDPYALAFYGYDPGVGDDYFVTGHASVYGYHLRRFSLNGSMYTDTITAIVPVPNYSGSVVHCLEGLSDGTALLVTKQQSSITYYLIDLQGDLVTTNTNVIFDQYVYLGPLSTSRNHDTLLILGSVTPNSTTNGCLLLQKVTAPNSSTQDNITVSSIIELSKNNPNPFHDSTWFTCKVSQIKKLDISVYNLRGQKVRSIFDGVLAPGKSEFMWDGKDERGQTVPSGVYYVRVASGRESNLLKVIKFK